MFIMKKAFLATMGMGILASMTMASATTGFADEAEAKDSTANFTITAKDPGNPTDPDNGTLTLKEVPSFNYGVLEASSIYSGFTGKAAQAEGKVLVSDTRLGTSDWTLTANMDKFTNSKTSLEGAALDLSAIGTLGEDFTGVIKDDKSPVELAKGNGSHGKDEFLISAENAKLTLSANPKANLAADDAFETTINWNLSSSQPVAPTA